VNLTRQIDERLSLHVLHWWITAGLLGIFTLLAVIGGLFAVDYLRGPQLSYTNIPFPVRNGERVHVGDTLHIWVEKCLRDDRPHSYIVARELIGLDHPGVVIPIGATAIMHLPGCNGTESRQTVIPSGTPTGEYVLRGYTQVIDKVRPFTIEWVTQPFQIVGSDE
jgi:hypothetical protein